MSLNSLESEGLRPLHCLLLVQRLLWGKYLCGWSLSPSSSLSMTLFHYILALFFIQKASTCLCEETTGVSGWLWPCFGFWALEVSSHLWLSYSCVKTAKLSYFSGSLVAVERVCCQRGMLGYGNKTPLDSSPSPLSSQEDLLWLFSSHLCCKITSLS